MFHVDWLIDWLSWSIQLWAWKLEHWPDLSDPSHSVRRSLDPGLSPSARTKSGQIYLDKNARSWLWGYTFFWLFRIFFKLYFLFFELHSLRIVSSATLITVFWQFKRTLYSMTVFFYTKGYMFPSGLELAQKMQKSRWNCCREKINVWTRLSFRKCGQKILS